MLDELKRILDEQGKAFEQFKAANEKELLEIKKRGEATAETKSIVDKINEDLSRLNKEAKAEQARIDEIEKKLNRPRGIGGDNGLTPEQEEHKKAFSDYLRKGESVNLRSLEKKAMSVGSDPDGGYMVPTEVEKSIDRILASNVAMRRVATVRSIGANSYKKPVVTAGTSGGWLGETGDSAETTTPKFSLLEFVPGRVYAEPWTTNDNLEDSDLDIESFLSDESSITFNEIEGSALLSGNGIAKPRGPLNYPIVANGSYSWGSLGYVPSGAAGAFAASNPSDALVNLVHALKRGYRNGASWMMNDLTLSAIRKFKDGQGNYIWQPGLQAGVADKLLGYNIEIDDYMPDVGVNSHSIMFGDFKRGYLIVDRRGIAVIRDDITKKGYTKFHMSKRVGGGVQNFEAIKVMRFAAA